MTTSELGRAVKGMHPEYARHADAAVGRAMKVRFAGVYDHVQDDPDANTVPEAPKTLQIQLDQLKAGKRRAVLLPTGTKVDPRKYQSLPHKSRTGLFLFNPKALKRADLVQAIKDRRLNEVLGSSDKGMGAPSKQGLKPPVMAVVGRDAKGTTAQGTLTDPAHEKQTIEATGDVTPRGGSISIEPPAKELANRLKSKKFRPVAGKRWPKVPEKR